MINNNNRKRNERDRNIRYIVSYRNSWAGLFLIYFSDRKI